MLGLWEKPADDIQRQHFAFRISLEDMKYAKQDLLSRGLEPRNFLLDGTKDPMVFAWMPAVAIYFQDPDGHSLEYIATLEGEPRPDLGVISWAEWDKLQVKSRR